MKKRMFLMVIAALVFIAAIAAVKTRQIQAGMKAHAAFQMPPEAVTTVVAKSENWPATWNAIGSVAAVQGVMVSADLPGIVETISFESGQMVQAGAVLVRLDTKQEEAQLAAAEAGKELANLNLQRAKGLVEQGIQAQSDLDRLDAEYKQAVAKIGEIRATIQRKTIRAPFAGVLGIRQVNLGQYLDGGAPVVPLQAIRPVYVNFAVPQQEVAQLKIGFPDPRHGRGGRASLPTERSRRSTPSSTSRRATSRCRRRWTTRTARCARACSSRRTSAWALRTRR